MRIGTVKETKTCEYRVGLTPPCVDALVSRGHSVFIERGAGLDAGYSDADYESAGSQMIDTPQAVFEAAEMVLKVKEPQPDEFQCFHRGQILFTFLHLAADRKLTEALLRAGVKAVAYETVEKECGELPLLKPMSEIAGRLSVQEGARFLERPFGGKGILMGGIPGVERAQVMVLGGGIVGLNAAKIAVGLGAEVRVLDVNLNRLEYIDDIFGGRVGTLFSSKHNIEQNLARSDLIIGAVLLPGAKAPRLIRKEHLAMIREGSVIVDVSIDQGGCVETSHPTTYDDPVFVVDGVTHYCVANIPGAVSRTATQALTNVSLPYVLLIAEKGIEKAAACSQELARGVNVYNGRITYRAVAEAFAMDYTPLEKVVKTVRV